MQSRFANLLARTVRYFESPDALGDDRVRGTRTLVLLHAFPLSADMWLPQLARVPQGWRFIAPDIRGFRGEAPAYEDAELAGATMDDYAADVLALLDHLDVDRAAVAGLSMGGYVAMAAAALAPARVTRLILADTRMTADTDDGRANRDRMKAAVLADGPAAVADAMVPKLTGATSQRDQPELSEAIRRMILVNRAEAIAGAIDAMKTRPDRRAALADFGGKALVICGEEDTITPPEDSDAMAATLPHARLVRIPGAGHLSNLEQPSAFNQALASFLSD